MLGNGHRPMIASTFVLGQDNAPGKLLRNSGKIKVDKMETCADTLTWGTGDASAETEVI